MCDHGKWRLAQIQRPGSPCPDCGEVCTCDPEGDLPGGEYDCPIHGENGGEDDEE